MKDLRKSPKGALKDALHKAQPGERFLYHTGELCGGALREEAGAASDAGIALLFKRRIGHLHFEYIAVRSKTQVRT